MIHARKEDTKQLGAACFTLFCVVVGGRQRRRLQLSLSEKLNACPLTHPHFGRHYLTLCMYSAPSCCHLVASWRESTSTVCNTAICYLRIAYITSWRIQTATCASEQRGRAGRIKSRNFLCNKVIILFSFDERLITSMKKDHRRHKIANEGKFD